MKVGYMANKLHVEKAYDSLEWTFIKKHFNVLGLYNKWTNWTIECIITTTFTILANQNPGIYPGRRICQGHPISLYGLLYVQKILGRYIHFI